MKISKQKLSKIVPVRTPQPQQALFPDMFTEQQEALLTLADGSRTPAALAAALGLESAETEKLIENLARAGYLRAATTEEMLGTLTLLPNLGRHEDAIRLAQQVLTQRRGDIPTLTLLANMLEVSARPQEAAAQWQFISQIHIHENRPGEALLAARKAAALQPFTHALQDALAELCLETGRRAEAVRCWCAFARRLADQQKTDEALAVLDYAQSRIPNEDLLQFTEAEILAVRDGHPRKRDLPPHLLKKKSLNSRGWPALSAAAVLLGILCALTLGATDYLVRERLLAAAEQAAADTEKIAAFPLWRKAAAAARIAEGLQAAAPTLSWMETAEYRRSLRLAREYREKAEAALEASRKAQLRELERWRANKVPENEDVLSGLLLADDPESPSVQAARAEWRSWRERARAEKLDKKTVQDDKP